MVDVSLAILGLCIGGKSERDSSRSRSRNQGLFCDDKDQRYRTWSIVVVGNELCGIPDWDRSRALRYIY